MERPNTIRDLMATTRAWLEKKGVSEARLETELLIAHALKMKRLDLFLDLDRPLTDAELDACRGLVLRRGKREPLSYITGTREMYGLSFEVGPAVLIPRQDTETLVDVALERIDDEDEGCFIDVCTGSGCVALAILHERPGLTCVATDLSPDAIAVAQRNAERTGLADRFEARVGDLLAPCAGMTVRLVVGNPPYVREAEMQELMPEVRDHEPRMALLGEGDDGLGHHRRILAQARALLEPGGFVALELGASQGVPAAALHPEGFGDVVVVKDLGKQDRVALWGRRSALPRG